MNPVRVECFDSSQGDTIEYSKSGKKKKKVVSKSKKGEYQELKSPPSSAGKLTSSSKEKNRSTGALKKSTEKDSTPKKEKKPGTPVKPKKLEKPGKNRVGPSNESALLIQRRKQKFNTMPTELPSASLKISRTNSEENLKLIKRSASSTSQEPMLGVLSEFNISVPTIPQIQVELTPPPISPHRQNLSVKIEVDWNKKTQILEIGHINLHKLKEIVAISFNFDLDFVSKMCLDVVLEYYHNGKFEPLSDVNIQNIYHGNGKLRLVFVDDSEEDGE